MQGVVTDEWSLQSPSPAEVNWDTWLHIHTTDDRLCHRTSYCDGPLLHNERLLTDVISTVRIQKIIQLHATARRNTVTARTDMRFNGNQPRIMQFGRVKASFTRRHHGRHLSHVVAVAPLEALPYRWWRKDANFRATSLAAPPPHCIVLYEGLHTRRDCECTQTCLHCVLWSVLCLQTQC
jgi:hypothetical protein